MRRPRSRHPNLLEARWSDLAERDLGMVYEYLAEHSPAGSRAVVNGLLATVRRLREFPLLGARSEEVEPEGDLRQFPWRHWVVFYRVGDGHIAILRVWDSRRNPDSLRIPSDAAPHSGN